MSAELFVEILHEELPAAMIMPAVRGLEKGVRALLKGIEHGAVRAYTTPRRLAVQVLDVAEGKPEVEQLVTGPPADRAFDAEGHPTRAAMGFARGKGIDVEQLQIVEVKGRKVAAAVVRSGGERTVDVVAAGLEQLVLGLPFKKSMEWGSGGVRWGRPLHGVAALYDGQPIAGQVAGMTVAPRTVGHRLAPQGAFDFTDCATWLQGLRDRKVEPDLAVRRKLIRDLLDDVSAELGADPIDVPWLLDEVVHLVEWPVAVVGRFDEDLLHLPARLLVESMTVHQRYFPIHRGGQLTSSFAIISNNPWASPEVVAEGNARVIRARFHDARFFYAEDRKRRLEDFSEELSTMRWIRGLGTMADKQQRISALARQLAPLTGADPEQAARAGALCKADLLSQMVGEFAELQGHMGKLYALHQGEAEAVAVAIEEHYLPQGSGDEVAASPVGAAVALADRLDTLAGCFSIGMVPKGSGDPQGLRRAAVGVLATIQAHGLRVDLGQLFTTALQGFPAETLKAEVSTLATQLVDFTLTRFKAQAVSAGASADLVDAVLAVSDPRPLRLQGRLDALLAVAGTEDFPVIMQTFKRVLNISKGQQATRPSAEQCREEAERALLSAIEAVEPQVAAASEALDFSAALDAVLSLRLPVADFFDAVLVDDPDLAVKAVRMGLLLEVGRLFMQVADFSKISTR